MMNAAPSLVSIARQDQRQKRQELDDIVDNATHNGPLLREIIAAMRLEEARTRRVVSREIYRHRQADLRRRRNRLVRTLYRALDVPSGTSPINMLKRLVSSVELTTTDGCGVYGGVAMVPQAQWATRRGQRVASAQCCASWVRNHLGLDWSEEHQELEALVAQELMRRWEIWQPS